MVLFQFTSPTLGFSSSLVRLGLGHQRYSLRLACAATFSLTGLG